MEAPVVAKRLGEASSSRLRPSLFQFCFFFFALHLEKLEAL